MVDGNLVEMGKLIGAGLACTGMGGAAIGVGHVVGNFLSGALRNPSALLVRPLQCLSVLHLQKL